LSLGQTYNNNIGSTSELKRQFLMDVHQGRSSSQKRITV